MIDLQIQMVIITVFIAIVLAFILRQLFLLKQKVDKQGEEQQKQQKEVQKQEQLQSGNVMKVFEQIKANQAKLQKDMEKVQIQIDNNSGEGQHQSEGQNVKNPIAFEQIHGKQLQIQEDMAKMQTQIGKYGNIFQLVNSNEAFKLKLIRKTIRFVVQNCAELFKQPEFNVVSGAIEVIGFSWYLKATTDKKGFLGLFLCAKPPDGFNDNYRIEVEYRISVMNESLAKDLAKILDGKTYEKRKDGKCGWGWPHMAEFENLLDPAKGFLRADGSIEVEADFTIKSATLDHLI